MRGLGTARNAQRSAVYAGARSSRVPDAEQPTRAAPGSKSAAYAQPVDVDAPISGRRKPPIATSLTYPGCQPRLMPGPTSGQRTHHGRRRVRRSSGIPTGRGGGTCTTSAASSRPTSTIAESHVEPC